MGCCCSIPIVSDSLVMRKNSCRNIYYDPTTGESIEKYCDTKWIDEIGSVTKYCPSCNCKTDVAQCYYGHKMLTPEQIIERLSSVELSRITYVSYDRSLKNCSRRLILHSSIKDHCFVFSKYLAIGIYPHIKDSSTGSSDLVEKTWKLINARLPT